MEGGQLDLRLSNATLVGQMSAGSPLEADEFWVGDLDGAPDEQGELLVIRGGRVEALTLVGRPIWRSDQLNVSASSGS